MRVLISTLVLALFLTAWAMFARGDGSKSLIDKPKADSAPADIDGYYSFTGKTPQGKTYSGIAVIKKANEVYLVHWNTTGAVTVGVGFRQADTLSVGWCLEGEKGVLRGVNVYKISAGPKLVGRQASLPSNGTVTDEVMHFLKALPDDDE